MECEGVHHAVADAGECDENAWDNEEAKDATAPDEPTGGRDWIVQNSLRV